MRKLQTPQTMMQFRLPSIDYRANAVKGQHRWETMQVLIALMCEQFAIADINQAVQHVRDSKARYRAVVAV